MEKQFDVIIKTRKNFLNLIDELSIEALNEIPDGFNNNIAWNFAHIIVAQQALCYSKSGVKPRIDEALIIKYQKGTKPESFIDAAEINLFKKLSLSLIDELRDDMKTSMFDNYQKAMTSFGVELTNVEDAVKYFAMHDGLHLGYALALARLVR